MWRPSCQQTKVSTTDVTITTLPQYFMYFYLCISRPTCQQTKVFTSAESITTRPQSFVFAAREIFEQPYFSFHSIAFYRRGSSLQVENLSVCLSVAMSMTQWPKRVSILENFFEISLLDLESFLFHFHFSISISSNFYFTFLSRKEWKGNKFHPFSREKRVKFDTKFHKKN